MMLIEVPAAVLASGEWQGGMRPPIVDHDPGLDAISEPFHRQALVAELAVETFVGAVLPRLARIDERGFDLLLKSPCQQRGTDEFGAVVGPYVTWCAMQTDEAAQYLDNPAGANRSGHVNGQAFPRVFIDHGQAFELLSVGAGVKHKVIAPDRVSGRGGERSGPTLRNAAPTPLGGYLQTGLRPQHRASFLAQHDALAGQHHANSA